MTGPSGPFGTKSTRAACAIVHAGADPDRFDSSAAGFPAVCGGHGWPTCRKGRSIFRLAHGWPTCRKGRSIFRLAHGWPACPKGRSIFRLAQWMADMPERRSIFRLPALRQFANAITFLYVAAWPSMTFRTVGFASCPVRCGVGFRSLYAFMPCAPQRTAVPHCGGACPRR
jgi:hypothetical protein